MSSRLLSTLRTPFCVHRAIDLGTANCRVYAPDAGVVLREPSVVAVDVNTDKVLHRGHAVGSVARIMEGRTPDRVRTVRPLQHGVVADIELCASILRHLLEKTRAPGWARRPAILIGVPSGITRVERQAAITSAERSGARNVRLIYRTHAAALGAGLPIHEGSASMICDVGAGTTEIGVLCLGSIAVSESLRVGGDDMDVAIQTYLRREHKLRIGQQTAERIKLDIGSATDDDGERTCEVRGGDARTGLPSRIEISSRAAVAALERPVSAIVDAVQRTLERCHPEIAADLIDNGMTLCGGGSLLRGIDRRLASATGMPVRVSAEPLDCVVRGIGRCIEDPAAWQGMFDLPNAA